MHEMGFTKHECCTSVHFSGMISIRLETCKPFSSSKPQMQYNRVVYRVYIAPNCTAHCIQALASGTQKHARTFCKRLATNSRDIASANNTSRCDAPYLFVWQRVLYKYANIDHFISQKWDRKSGNESKSIETSCSGMLWSCLMKQEHTDTQKTHLDCFS